MSNPQQKQGKTNNTAAAKGHAFQMPTDKMTEAELTSVSEAITSDMEALDQKIKQLEAYIAQQGKFRAPALSSTQRAFSRGPTCCGGIHAEQDLADSKELTPQERLFVLNQARQAKSKLIADIQRIRSEREERERQELERLRREQERERLEKERELEEVLLRARERRLRKEEERR